MSDIQKLLGLLAKVPILHVDPRAARARGDHEAARYAEAVQRWQHEAERVLDEAERPAARQPDAYHRAAVASELSRLST